MSLQIQFRTSTHIFLFFSFRRIKRKRDSLFLSLFYILFLKFLDFLLYGISYFDFIFSIVSSLIFCPISHSNARFYFHLSFCLFLPFLSLFCYFPPLYLTVEINSFRSLFSFARQTEAMEFYKQARDLSPKIHSMVLLTKVQ